MAARLVSVLARGAAQAPFAPTSVASQRLACRLRLDPTKPMGGSRSLVFKPLITPFSCGVRFHHRDHTPAPIEAPSQGTASESTQNYAALQACLWLLACFYALWLFILPYAPGDPVWSIKLETISMVLDLSMNFFFILPLTNWLGVHVLESPAVHPTAEALFNVIVGWSVMFAPLLFTDSRRDRYGGSLVILWGVQMLLTNLVLIPYMAIRLNQQSSQQVMPSESSVLKFDFTGVRQLMTAGARVVSVVCGTVGVSSMLWFLWGRPDEGFGNLSDRWAFFLEYLSSDRVGYAFVLDICLYSVFQAWLIGDNLCKNDRSNSDLIRYLRYVPYVGLVAFLWCLPSSEDPEMV